MKQIYLGAKYYKVISENHVEILRVMNDKDINNIKCSVNGSLIKKRISLTELENEYTRLTPDGILYINSVKIQDIEDVILMLYRRRDIDEGDTVPYCVCRQNITDLFANVIDPDYKNMICGISVTKDTIPENVKMDSVLGCDSVIDSVGFCVYLNDTIDTLFKFFKSKNYDIILYNLFQDHVNYKYKENKNDYINKRQVDGYCKNLRDLMIYNEFMYDFYTGFNVYPVDLVISEEEINHSLSLTNTIMINSIICKNITNSIVIPYDNTIDIDKMTRDYILIQDRNLRVYIVAYIYTDDYQIPVQDIESIENIEKLSRIKGYATNLSIVNAIRFNIDKYEQ